MENKLNEYIFSDFDGTISRYDVIHTFITNFAKGDPSVAEEKWCRGEISSKECYDIQFELINGLSKKKFYDFINSVEIDPYFEEFYRYEKKNGKKIIVLSDGLDMFINLVFKRHNIELPIFSNHLILTENEGKLNFKIEYPNEYKNCKIGLGVCKCGVAKTFAKDFTYIGDGLSDRCIAQEAQLVFAKKSLDKICRENKINYVHFETFEDILNYEQLSV